MTSIKRAGRITTLGFAVGTGLLIASGVGAAVASATPDDSGHASSSSASNSSSSSARSARPSASTVAKPKPARTVSARSDYSAPVVQLHTKRTATADISAVPAASAKTVAPKRVPALPTPAEFQQAIVAGLGTVRQNLDELRQKIEALIRNQIIGFQDNLVVLRIDLERVFNPNKQVIYGNLANAQYWATSGAQTANLMAAAMVISALKGQTVTAQNIIDEATNTDSVAQPDRKMYLGTDTSDWVWASDAVQLMETHGLKVTTVYYTKSQEQRALDGIETALSQGKSVIVAINGTVVSSNTNDDRETWKTEHQAVLLGINVTKNVVYLNDGANPQGQNLTMSLEDFLDSWQTSRYTAVFAELAPAPAQAASSDEGIAA